MASKTSGPEAETSVIRMAEMGARVSARREKLDLPDLPRNAGNNRTPGKRALLKAIDDAGGKW